MNDADRQIFEKRVENKFSALTELEKLYIIERLEKLLEERSVTADHE